MAVSREPANTVTGTVASVNPKGLKLDGSADWLNFSKFAVDLVPPMRGQTVTLTLDRAGFIRTVQVDQEASGSHRAASGPRGEQSGQRETTITRLAVLKAAAEFAAARRPQVKSGEVLKIAESWERWVNRPADTLDLTDAL